MDGRTEEYWGVSWGMCHNPQKSKREEYNGWAGHQLGSKSWRDGARTSKREAERRLQKKNRRSLEARKKNKAGIARERKREKLQEMGAATTEVKEQPGHLHLWLATKRSTQQHPYSAGSNLVLYSVIITWCSRTNSTQTDTLFFFFCKDKTFQKQITHSRVLNFIAGY